MNTPARTLPVAPRWPVLLAWGVFAAVAGLACVVLPPHLIPGGIAKPNYGTPLVPWFESAWENLQFGATFAALAVMGAILGLAQPRWWALLACLTVVSVPAFWTINFIHDVTLNPTSHNLVPFEVIALGVLMVVFALAALAGGWLASEIRRSVGRGEPRPVRDSTFHPF